MLATAEDVDSRWLCPEHDAASRLCGWVYPKGPNTIFTYVYVYTYIDLYVYLRALNYSVAGPSGPKSAHV